MNSQGPMEIAVAVVRQGDMVLIGRRQEGTILGGYWEFPGGRIELGEAPEEAAARECLEETAIAIRVSGILAVVDHHYDHGALRLHFFDAVPVDRQPVPCVPFRWVPMAELDAYAFPPANAAVLKALESGC